MAEIGNAFLSIVPSMRGFGRSVESQVGGETAGVGRRLGSTFGKAFAAGGALLAAAGVGKFLKDSIAEAREAQKVGAQTAAVIKSTGGAANLTAAQFGNLANKISAYAGIDDEAIQQGENLLATFTNVKNLNGNNIFTRATKLATDMSVALGTDVKSSALQLGKALNDPAKGFSRLQRSGVSFSETQIDQIKNFQKSGQLAKAQGIILGEVAKEFGGSAKAQATAGDKAKVAFKNLEEAAGTALLPVFDSVLNAITPVLLAMTNGLPGAVSKVKSVFSGLFASLNGGSGSKAGEVFTQIKSAVAAAAPVVQQFAQAFVTNLLPVLQAMAITFKTQVLPAITALIGYVVANFLPIFQQVAGIFTGQILPILGAVGTFIYSKVYPALIAIATVVATNLKPVFDQLAVTFQTQILPAIQGFLIKMQALGPTLAVIAGAVLKVVGFVLKLASAILGAVLPVVIKFAGFLIGRLFGALGTVISIIVRVVGFIVRLGSAFLEVNGKIAAFVSGAVKKVGKFVGVVAALPGQITGALGDLSGLLSDAGKQLINGLVAGFNAVKHKVEDAVQAVIDKIPKKVRKLMGIASPSKVMAELGRFISQGLAVGIDASGRVVEGAMSRLVDTVRKGGKKAKNSLVEVAKNLASQMSDALSSLDAAKQTVTDFASSVRDSFTSLGDLSDSSLGSTAQDIISSLQARVASAAQFAQVINSLKAAGLNGDSLKQLIAAGPVNGLGPAQALAEGGADAIAQVNTLEAQLTSSGQALGDSLATSFYQSGVDAAQGLVNGLQSQEDALVKIAAKLGKKLLKSVKQELGIKSPSREMAYVGDMAMAGLLGSLDSSSLYDAGTELARSLRSGASLAQPDLAGAGVGGTGPSQTYNIYAAEDPEETANRVARRQRAGVN